MSKLLKENKMKSYIVSIAVVTGLTFAGSVMSADMPDIAKKNGCASCHAIDKKVVGPAWQAVADKYKGDAGAADKLSTKISKGGGGVWGAVPMPPQPKLSDADKKELVSFILGLAK
jgi:cytochrome c